MTQEERWMTKYNEVVTFIETNKRNPSKYVDEERGLVNWMKQQRKLVNAGELTEPRLGQFMELMELSRISINRGLNTNHTNSTNK